MTTAAAAWPYCGAPPASDPPWNLDPWLIAALLFGYALVSGRFHFRSTSDRLGFSAGWLLMSGLLLSPLCNLSVALFSARAGQHVLLALCAAPLLALGWPHRPSTSRRRLLVQEGSRLWAAAILFALVLWTWHLPGPYEQTFRSIAVYWLMQLTLVGSATLFWRALFGARSALSVALVALITAMQMSLLGAFLTLAPRALFSVHAGTTQAWNLSPLEDQQLGGLLMWAPGGLLFTLLALVRIARMIEPQAARLPSDWRERCHGRQTHA